jgi:para-aminobenzoate synthetase/4-amino-4-deoxychorismate lyase
VPGLFTTLRVDGGRARYWTRHVARLVAGAERFGLEPPAEDALAEAVAAAAAGAACARVRVLLPQGGGHVVTASSWSPPQGPWTLAPVVVGPADERARWKTADRARYDGARARRGGADEALLVDAEGRWLECAAANVFLVLEDGGVLTPPAALPLLPGVVRAMVLEGASALGLTVSEGPVTAEIASRARGAFVTNALLGVHPVAAIEGVGRFPDTETAALLRDAVARPRPEDRIL